MKIIKKITTKKELFTLYNNQYSQKKIRKAIATIIAQYRPTESPKCRRISQQEALTFIAQYGTPQGYTLSQELQTKLKTINH